MDAPPQQQQPQRSRNHHPRVANGLLNDRIVGSPGTNDSLVNLLSHPYCLQTMSADPSVPSGAAENQADKEDALRQKLIQAVRTAVEIMATPDDDELLVAAT